MKYPVICMMVICMSIAFGKDTELYGQVVGKVAATTSGLSSSKDVSTLSATIQAKPAGIDNTIWMEYQAIVVNTYPTTLWRVAWSCDNGTPMVGWYPKWVPQPLPPNEKVTTGILCHYKNKGTYHIVVDISDSKNHEVVARKTVTF